MTAQITHAEFQLANQRAIDTAGAISGATTAAIDYLIGRRASDTQLDYMRRVADASRTTQMHLTTYLEDTNKRYHDTNTAVQNAGGEVADDKNYQE